MGDPKRNIIFANFIKRNFSPKKYSSVLVIADGKGELALELSGSYKVRVIEAKPRQIDRRKRVKYTSGWFTESTPVEQDFIVGMHPDEATGAIILAARRNNKHFAVVPCCIKGGLETHGVSSFTAWINKLRSLAGRYVNQTTLGFSGKNTVLWS